MTSVWGQIKAAMGSICEYIQGMSIKWHLLFQRLDILERNIMASNAELVEKLNAEAAATAALTAQVGKIGTETASLLAAVDALQDAVDAAGGTTPEVDAALQGVTDARTSLSVALQAVDEAVPDAAPPAP